MAIYVFTVFVRMSSCSILFIYDLRCIHGLCKHPILFYVVYTWSLIYLLSLLGRHIILCCLYKTFNVLTVVVLMPFYSMLFIYAGHPISSDNGLISQTLLLKSEFYYPLHVTMCGAYSCLKYGVFFFISTWPDAIQIYKQHCGSLWPRKSHFNFFCLG